MSQTTVAVKLPGLMNGATITTTGDFAFTGKIVNPVLLAKYERLASTGKRQFRGRVTKIGPDKFRLDFDKLPFVK